MKRFLILCSAATFLSACGLSAPAATATPLPPTVTASLTATSTQTPSPTPTATATLTPTSTPYPTSTFVPAQTYPPDAFAGWKTVAYAGMTVKIPPAFYSYVPSNYPAPILYIADSKATYSTWMHEGDISNKLIMELLPWGLDRRSDPNTPDSPLVPLEPALQKAVTMMIGHFTGYVGAGTEVPYENYGGGTFDGGASVYQHIPYVNVMFGPYRAARFFSPDGWAYYFILRPDVETSSLMERVIVQPGGTTMLPLAEQILSTFEFDK